MLDVIGVEYYTASVYQQVFKQLGLSKATINCEEKLYAAYIYMSGVL